MQSVLRSSQVTVRINGTLPELSHVSNAVLSERAMEINNTGEMAATSCSIVSHINGSSDNVYHILVDIGPGVVNSLKKIPKSANLLTDNSFLPNGLLITHSHEDHVTDLPSILSLYNNRVLKIYCTPEVKSHLFDKYPEIKINPHAEFVGVKPDRSIDLGPFAVTPISVNHFDYDTKSSLPGCVIYVIANKNSKIVIGWDFLTINGDIDQKLLRNPDLLILGTETYNSHPSSGIISVAEAITFLRRWNAKYSFIVHYSGAMDIDDKDNQWFRGPVKPLTSSELQRNIDEQLRIAGDNGKFKVTVAKEGMTWVSNTNEPNITIDSVAPENPITVESLQNYIFQLEMKESDNKLNLMIEDSVNRYSLEFVSPFKFKSNENVVYGKAIKGMMARGPQLKIEVGINSGVDIVHIEVLKGKKFIFNNDISVSEFDAERIKKFIHEFIPSK